MSPMKVTRKFIRLIRSSHCIVSCKVWCSRARLAGERELYEANIRYYLVEVGAPDGLSTEGHF